MLTCLATVLIGFGATLTKTDTLFLNEAKKGCARIYPDAPCLTKFIKKEQELVYNAVCGPKVKK